MTFDFTILWSRSTLGHRLHQVGDQGRMLSAVSPRSVFYKANGNFALNHLMMKKIGKKMDRVCWQMVDITISKLYTKFWQFLYLRTDAGPV